MTRRPPWDTHFLRLAALTAERSTCPRAAVGCVLTFNNRIISTGYNGAPSGMAHCTDAGCTMHDGHCLRTVHAEANAIADAARRGVMVEGAIAYITHAPCIHCAKLLVSAGVQRIVYAAPYEDGANMQFLAVARVTVQRMKVQP